MTAKIESERRGDLLLLRLVGTVAFEESDRKLEDDLLALLETHAAGGGRRLLVDLARTRFIFSASSFPLVTGPIVRQDPARRLRTAFMIGHNERVRALFAGTALDRLLPLFDNEVDALEFLKSDEPLTPRNPAPRGR